jgi:hypothetical protein
VATYLGRAAAESGDYTRQMVRGDIRAYADLKNLEAAYTALSDAGPAMQPVAFARHVSLADAEIVLRHYTPSLPLSMEGMAYGGAGLLLGLFIAWVLESPLRVWHDMRRKRRQRQRRRVRQDPTLDTQARQTGTTA